MNSTNLNSNDIPTYPEGQSITSFSYGFGLTLGVLIFILILVYSSFICRRRRSNPTTTTAASATTSTDSVATQQTGVDEATLLNFPKLFYSQAQHRGSTAASGCSICLADYKDTDVLCLLPDCGHLFHIKCVEPWLRLNPTCPNCRNLPMPTPPATPAKVAPLRIVPI